MKSMVGKLRKGTTLGTHEALLDDVSCAQAHDIFNRIPKDIKQRGVKDQGWMDGSHERWPKFSEREEKQNDKAKKVTNKTKHTKATRKPEICNTKVERHDLRNTQEKIRV